MVVYGYTSIANMGCLELTSTTCRPDDGLDPCGDLRWTCRFQPPVIRPPNEHTQTDISNMVLGGLFLE